MSAVCVDAGTTMIEAVGFDDARQERTVARRSVAVSRPRPGWSEQDMTLVRDAAFSAIRDAAAAGDVEFLALTAQGDGCWLVDGAAAPAGPAVLWNDARADAHTRRWLQIGVLERAFAVNGSQAARPDRAAGRQLRDQAGWHREQYAAFRQGRENAAQDWPRLARAQAPPPGAL